MERDLDEFEGEQAYEISTHTLTWSVTIATLTLSIEISISTHTLTWSVTLSFFKDFHKAIISTHTLTWSVTHAYHDTAFIYIFQLTRSRGA